MIPGPAWALIIIAAIFLMIGGLIELYFRSKAKAAKAGALKEGDKGFERETRLFSLFQNIEDMMDGFEAFVDETRAALDMDRVELLREKEEIARMNANVSSLLQKFHQEIEDARVEAEAAREAALAAAMLPPEPVPVSEPIAPSPAPAPVPDKPVVREPVSAPTSARAVSIWALHCEGKDIETIARELGISHTEVSLTMRVLLGE